MRNIKILGPASGWFDHPHRWKYARFMATLTKIASSSPKEHTTRTVQPPINLENWIEQNREKFFIPPNVPHAPVRPPDTIGVVVERRRPPGEHEHVIFYCDNCGALVEDIDFDCGDIVEHFSQAMLDFWNDDARRTCKKCGMKVPQPEPVKPFEK